MIIDLLLDFQIIINALIQIVLLFNIKTHHYHATNLIIS